MSAFSPDLYIELPTRRGRTSTHLINARHDDLVTDFPHLADQAVLVSNRRVLIAATLARENLALTPLRHRSARLAHLALRHRAMYLVTFTSITVMGECDGVDIHGLPMKTYDRVDDAGILTNGHSGIFSGNRYLVTIGPGDEVCGPTRIAPGYFLIQLAGQNDLRFLRQF